MSKYAIFYDYANEYSEEHDIRTEFVGSWSELQEEIEFMKENGCYHIDAVCIDDPDF